MAAANEIRLGRTIPDRAGAVIATQASHLVVLHKDTTAENGNPLDPWGVAAGQGANHANSVIVPTSSFGNFLALWHVYNGTLATAPVIKVYGRYDLREQKKVFGGRLLPADVDSTEYPNPDYWWVPLPLAEDDTTTSVTVGTTTDEVSSIYWDTTDMSASRMYRFKLEGATAVMVVVSTAAVGVASEDQTSSGSAADVSSAGDFTGLIMGMIVA